MFLSDLFVIMTSCSPLRASFQDVISESFGDMAPYLPVSGGHINPAERLLTRTPHHFAMSSCSTLKAASGDGTIGAIG